MVPPPAAASTLLLSQTSGYSRWLPCRFFATTVPTVLAQQADVNSAFLRVSKVTGYDRTPVVMRLWRACVWLCEACTVGCAVMEFLSVPALGLLPARPLRLGVSQLFRCSMPDAENV